MAKLQKGYEGRVPDLHNPLGGGAPPACSALTLRLVLAIFGLVSSVGLAAAWIVGLLWLAVVLTVLAMIVAIEHLRDHAPQTPAVSPAMRTEIITTARGVMTESPGVHQRGRQGGLAARGDHDGRGRAASCHLRRGQSAARHADRPRHRDQGARQAVRYVPLSPEWRFAVLILAEGTIHRPIEGHQLDAVRAWLGPMVDSGFMHSGYVDVAGTRLWLLLTSESLAEAGQRLGDLPVVQDGSVSFATVAVTAARFR
jgi:hypothetical protein